VSFVVCTMIKSASVSICFFTDFLFAIM
jgi:hypothetical protein